MYIAFEIWEKNIWVFIIIKLINIQLDLQNVILIKLIKLLINFLFNKLFLIKIKLRRII